MGLKQRFFILMIGIAILPILTSALLIFALRVFIPGIYDLASTPEYRLLYILHSKIEMAIDSGDFSSLDKSLSRGGYQIENVTSGEVIHESAGLVAPLQSTHGVSIDYSIGGILYRVRLNVPPVPLGKGPEALLPVLPVLALGTIVIFTVVVSIGILRSMKRSIGTLDEATRQISAGNMDFELALPAGDSLASLGASMNAMRRKLKDEYARRDRFILAVSHDLKTPLAVLEGYLDAFEDGLADSPEKREQYLRVIRGKTGLLAHRISHLVELARMTTMEWRHTMVETDLAAYVDETLNRLADEVSADGGLLSVDFRMEPGKAVSMNRDMINRVLENLVDNARNYSPPGSTVSASAWNTPSDGFITISNPGPGIAPDQSELVFEPFFRGDPGRNSGGFGLGLSSVKSIVETHGWAITLASVPGTSTSFTIRIPLKTGNPSPQ